MRRLLRDIQTFHTHTHTHKEKEKLSDKKFLFVSSEEMPNLRKTIDKPLQNKLILQMGVGASFSSGACYFLLLLFKMK